MTLSLGWTLLVLLAAVMHAAWNVLVKFGDDALVNMTLIMGMAGVIALAFTPFVNFPDQESWIFLLGSLLTHIGYYIFLLFGYRYGDLSLVYPIARGSAPLLVGASSWLLVGEALSTTEMLGVAAISAGIFSLMIDRAHDREHKWRPVIFGLLTGLTIMSYTLCDGQGVRVAGDKWGYIVWLFVLDAPALVLIAWWRRGPVLWSLVALHWKVGAAGVYLSARPRAAAAGGAILESRRHRRRPVDGGLRHCDLCHEPGLHGAGGGAARDQRDLRRDLQRRHPEGALPPPPLPGDRHGRAGGGAIALRRRALRATRRTSRS